MSQLWITHRPDQLQHMVGLEQLKADVPNWVLYEQNKHKLRCGGVIFAGRPGTGKTSGGRAIAKDLLGGAFANNFHVFNASDERGIGFVRDRLKSLAEQRAVGHDFKVILLDEADGLTKDAQDAMRQLIEETGTHVLWILTCNHIGRIIPALRSRLPTYMFNPLSVDDAEGFLGRVIEDEGFPQEWQDSIPSLVSKYKGDMRACLKAMQTIDPTDEHSLQKLVEKDFEPIQSYYKGIIGGAMLIDSAQTLTNELGLTRDEIIEGMHEAILSAYKEDVLGQAVALKHLMILGQWAARSHDWTASDLLFLHAMTGDYKQRG
jgi:DNA polymerase III delta prime subunit